MESRTGTIAAVITRAKTLSNAQTFKGFGLVYLLLALNILDILTTHIGLQSGAVEANPLISCLIGEFGEASTYIIKLSVVFAAALAISRLGKTHALALLCCGFAAIVISNLTIFTQNLIG